MSIALLCDDMALVARDLIDEFGVDGKIVNSQSSIDVLTGEPNGTTPTEIIVRYIIDDLDYGLNATLNNNDNNLTNIIFQCDVKPSLTDTFLSHDGMKYSFKMIKKIELQGKVIAYEGIIE